MSAIRDAQFNLRQLREKLLLAGVPAEVHELAKKVERDLEKAYRDDCAQKQDLDLLQQNYDCLKAIRAARNSEPISRIRRA